MGFYALLLPCSQVFKKRLRSMAGKRAGFDEKKEERETFSALFLAKNHIFPRALAAN